MACNKLSSGKSLVCLDNVGGIKRAYIANSVDVASFTTDVDGYVTAITMEAGSPVPVFYQFDFQKTTGSLTSTGEISLENGTKGYVTELKLKFFQNEQLHFNQLDSLVSNNLSIVVEDVNGKLFLLGKEQGSDASAVSVTWGQQLSDMNGQEITFQSKEKSLPAELTNLAVISAVL